MIQHLEALDRANFVRAARAELKRAIKAGDVLAGEVLQGEIPDWLEQMRVEELCNAIPRFPWRTYQRVMQRTHTRLTAAVADLTPRKRCILGEALTEWEGDSEIRRARQRRRMTTNAVGRRKAA